MVYLLWVHLLFWWFNLEEARQANTKVKQTSATKKRRRVKENCVIFTEEERKRWFGGRKDSQRFQYPISLRSPRAATQLPDPQRGSDARAAFTSDAD